MTAYFRPPDNTIARAVAITPWSSGLIVPMWPAPQAWAFNGSGLSQIDVLTNEDVVMTKAGFEIVNSTTNQLITSTGYNFGYAAATTDAVSGAWLLPYTGNLVNLTATQVIKNYPLPTGRIFTGITFDPTRARIYALDSSGTLYTTASGLTIATLVSGFGNVPSWSLVSSGATLLTLQAGVSGIGTFTLTGSGTGASGFISAPMTNPTCLAATSGSVGVGGWSRATLASGFTDMGISPPTPTNFLGVNAATNSISLWQDSGTENWSFTQSITGTGHPTNMTWLPNGLGALVSDPIAGDVLVIQFSTGIISLQQTLPVPGAGEVATTPAGTKAIVCQPTLNEFTPLSFSSVWASGAAVALAGARSVLFIDNATAVMGWASGVAFLTASGSSWAVGSTGALPYTPVNLAEDMSGNIYAVGTAGASGYISVFTDEILIATTSFAGGASGIISRQDQFVVGDPINALLRTFEFTPQQTLVQHSTMAAPPGLDAMTIAAQTLFAAGASGTWEYQFTSPYQLEYNHLGSASILVSGSFRTATLSVFEQPTAVTFDVSGNLWAATLQNNYYEINAAGTIVASGAIAQNPPQPQTTPIGSSSWLWFNSHLYAASSLDGALIEVF